MLASGVMYVCTVCIVSLAWTQQPRPDGPRDHTIKGEFFSGTFDFFSSFLSHTSKKLLTEPATTIVQSFIPRRCVAFDLN